MNRLDMEGRVAVVTGGARGIGLAIAQRAAASGARVAVWDMDEAEARKVAAEVVPLKAFFGERAVHVEEDCFG